MKELSIYTGSKGVQYGSKWIHVTPLQFRTLLALSDARKKKKGGVADRGAIAKKVWPGEEVAHITIDQAISRLRKIFPPKVFVTHSGFGWSIAPEVGVTVYKV